MSDATPIIHTWGEHDLAREKMAQRFREWGEMAAEYDSPLYGVLADGVSKDDALLSLAMQRHAQPAPRKYAVRR